VSRVSRCIPVEVFGEGRRYDRESPAKKDRSFENISLSLSLSRFSPARRRSILAPARSKAAARNENKNEATLNNRENNREKQRRPSRDLYLSAVNLNFESFVARIRFYYHRDNKKSFDIFYQSSLRSRVMPVFVARPCLNGRQLANEIIRDRRVSEDTLKLKEA